MVGAAGDILVFLTGKAEIDDAVREINKGVAEMEEGTVPDLLVFPIYAALPLEMQVRSFVLIFKNMPSARMLHKLLFEETRNKAYLQKFKCLKLRVVLQARVFAPAPEGCRRCIVATNIAETSITVNCTPTLF